MKALEKDRNRRYETANGFAMDVQRYLSDEPVLACPPSAGYRLRKFARRNKVALVTSGLVAAAILIGSGISVWQAVEATHARRDADNRLEGEKQAVANAEQAAEEESKAKDIADIQRQRAEGNMHLALQVLHDLYRDMSSKWLVEDSDPEPWQREFLQQMLDFHQRFLRENAGKPALMYQMAKAHGATAEIYRHREELDKSKEAILQAIQIVEKLVQEFPNDPDFRQTLAGDCNAYGIVLAATGQVKQAEELFNKAIGLKEKLVAKFPNVGATEWN